MKKLLAILMLSLMVFTFVACTNEPVTEPKTTEQPTTEQPTTEQPTTEQPKTDTTVKINDELNIFTRNIDENMLMSKEDIKNIPLKINKGSVQIIFKDWEECENHYFLGKSTHLEDPYKFKGAVLKVKVNKIVPCIYFHPPIRIMAPTTFLDVSVSEVLKTYNGYEIKENDVITLVQRSGYAQDISSFFEGYGAKVTIENYGHVIEGLEAGYYELFFQKDKEYVYQIDSDYYLPILKEEAEFLVMVVYDEESERNYISYTCPIDTSNYKSLSTYKDFDLGTEMDSFITDFYNTFMKK